MTFQRVKCSNVATFQRSLKSTSRSWISTLRRSRGVQNQRRDVGISRRDVPEAFKINVATLESHVAMFQRGVKLTSRCCDVATLRANVATLQRRLKMQFKEPWSRIRENSPLINVTLWTFVVRYMNGLSLVPSIAGPKIIQPKRDTDYG